MNNVNTIPLALYIHLPWCEKKCPYCDFNSHLAGNDIPEDAYCRALLADLNQHRSELAGREIISIFFGGGTPSLFSAEAIATILDGVNQSLTIAADCEITMEANPGSAERGRFSGYRAAGVNRLSIGVQSLDDKQLKRLGRIHSAGDALAAIDHARAAGFERLNTDLMFALPKQSIDECLSDARTLLDQGITHLSAYQLTLEPGTPFFRHPPPLPDDDNALSMQQGVESLAQDYGLARYEVSAYATPGERCRHNLNYWSFGDYLGIGAGAHSKLTDAAAISRSMRHRAPRRYQRGLESGDFTADRHRVDTGDVLLEYLINHLRIVEPMKPEALQQRGQLEWSVLCEALAPAALRGWVTISPESAQITQAGRPWIDSILVDVAAGVNA
ncbi:radical SAM family heme chaperone HemW [Gammaproteobacteria bacterium]|nr:radical SAM family heme chaperone HemW [Gammaproteobacteria bacterium]